MIRAKITNNSNGMASVQVDLSAKASSVQVPAKSRHNLMFADKKSFEAAVEESKKTVPQTIFIVEVN